MNGEGYVVCDKELRDAKGLTAQVRKTIFATIGVGTIDYRYRYRFWQTFATVGLSGRITWLVDAD